MTKHNHKTPRAMFMGRNKITITFIVAIAIALATLFITGFIYEERNNQIDVYDNLKVTPSNN